MHFRTTKTANSAWLCDKCNICIAADIIPPEPPLGLLKNAMSQLIKTRAAPHPQLASRFAAHFPSRINKDKPQRNAKPRANGTSLGCARNAVSGSEIIHMRTIPDDIPPQTRKREEDGCAIPIKAATNAERVRGSQIVANSRAATIVPYNTASRQAEKMIRAARNRPTRRTKLI